MNLQTHEHIVNMKVQAQKGGCDIQNSSFINLYN